jgi:phosphonate transport system substrate-binding protein
MRVLAVPVYQGAPLYRAYLLAAAGRAATQMADLRGDIHAFSDPDSNSGHLVTRARLAEMNAEPDTFFRRTLFTYGHRNVIRAVASGLAQSGSVDGYVWDVIAELEPKLASATRVVMRSEPMGFPPVVASSTGDAAVASAISQALLTMRSSAKGRNILGTLRLDGFTAGEPGLYRGIEALVRRARRQG